MAGQYILIERDGWAEMGPVKCKIEGKDSLAAQTIHARNAKTYWPPSTDVTNVDGGSLFRLVPPRGLDVEDFHKHLRESIHFHPKLNPKVIELI